MLAFVYKPIFGRNELLELLVVELHVVTRLLWLLCLRDFGLLTLLARKLVVVLGVRFLKLFSLLLLLLSLQFEGVLR